MLRPLCLRRLYADEEETTRNSIAKDGYAITAKLESHVFVDAEKQQVYTVGDGSILRSGYHRVPQDGGYKYLGGSLTLDGKNFAYLFPL